LRVCVVNMYNIRFAKDNDIPSMRDFFSEVYSPGHVTTDKKYLAWQYRDAPGNIYYPNYPNLLLEKNKKIVGHLGLIPYKFRILGKVKPAAFLANLVVKKELRSYGAGAFLVKEAEKYFKYLYATGINDQAMPALNFCNWSKEKYMMRWVYDFSKNDVPPTSFKDSRIITIRLFDEIWDKSWQKMHKDYGSTIDRSAEYLNWRFINNPKVNYKIWGFVEKNYIKGYIVVRIERGVEYSACRIVDFISSQEAEPRLLKKALSFASTEKINFIDFFSLTVTYRKVFKGAGFSLYDSIKNPEPPIFILPVVRDKSRQTINFSYKNVNPKIALSVKDWFVTKSDGDKDRSP